jgi:hypothetical protein
MSEKEKEQQEIMKDFMMILSNYMTKFKKNKIKCSIAGVLETEDIQAEIVFRGGVNLSEFAENVATVIEKELTTNN